MSDSNQAQLEGLSHLLLLQQRARQAESEESLAFVLVNDSRLLVDYELAVLWLRKPAAKPGQGKLVAVSDIPDLDPQSAFAGWAQRLATSLDLESGSQPQLLTEQSQPPLPEGVPDQMIWVPLSNNVDGPSGGLLLARQHPWSDAEQRILSHWGEASGHALSALRSRPGLKRLDRSRRVRRWMLRGFICLLVAVQFVPVPLSVLAPAQVQPLEPLVVRSPLNSTVETLHVRPNQSIERGDPLLSLDDRALRTRLEVARQSLGIIQAEYRQAGQAALTDPKAKSALPLLTLKIEQQQAEVDYINALLARTEVLAERDGIVLLDDEDQLKGKPVQLGERLLTLADPARSELVVWLPVGDDIELQPGAPVRLFPTVSPESYIRATVIDIGYQALERAEVGLAYRVRARFDQDQSVPRIGQRGVARIEGDSVSLFFYLFRRPAAAVRQWFGL